MKNRKILLAFFLIIVLAVFVYWFGLNGSNKSILLNQTPTPTSSELKTFISTNLDFTLQLPQNFETEERFTLVEFKKASLTIGIDRNDASTYGSVKAFLTDFDEKNNVKEISFMDDLVINSYPSVVRNEKRGGKVNKMYYVYVDDWVYVFSTDAEELYDDLDQIVRSFRYTPN